MQQKDDQKKPLEWEKDKENSPREEGDQVREGSPSKEGAEEQRFDSDREKEISPSGREAPEGGQETDRDPSSSAGDSVSDQSGEGKETSGVAAEKRPDSGNHPEERGQSGKKAADQDQGRTRANRSKPEKGIPPAEDSGRGDTQQARVDRKDEVPSENQKDPDGGKLSAKERDKKEPDGSAFVNNRFKDSDAKGESDPPRKKPAGELIWRKEGSVPAAEKSEQEDQDPVTDKEQAPSLSESRDEVSESEQETIRKEDESEPRKKSLRQRVLFYVFLIVPAASLVALVIGLMIGYSVVGDDPAFEVFTRDLWEHLYNLIYG
ncbi:DNA-directed RNA polymerase subunit beta [Paludifilum halophilum]|uniref:DNA-directed RNA polymerase subunit beta n=1 Tax=Paludifilum halophilum TaxID=1642702 RepID=A0A235B718_9BACL|nr:DNA-directed RNA polymerase subunit beta [Paludifilum halophilum]OYD08031.1 hypothetical protein CHM34_07915 [Paludifilum halophilum]